MNKKLKGLFDLQKFQKNKRLDALVSETHSRYDKEISEEDLSEISAAGDVTLHSYQSFKREDDIDD